MSGPWGICEECNQENTGYEWCNACNAKHFQQNFKNWTSGNDDIDKCIQKTQLSANYSCEVLEWIPYNKFYDLNRIAKGGYSIVYREKCIDGFICNWDNKNQNWPYEKKSSNFCTIFVQVRVEIVQLLQIFG
ncbi:hypothetical protein RirG_168320 [Rhizophagus irregularis DAOM 197198w]|uniref:Protein kinase domain-containing protein n=1 Tax=Rhizophagus irregularis (strain DAOM 197198w) TaxID=1432141 RepID=A0A015KPP0_RHIIW|nr:hypothetical protein RirG_168320 [Rhizophagus irregularis DAOM 197198w]